MHVKREARLHLSATVPEGDSIVAAFPREIFCIEKIDTLFEQDTAIVWGGRLVPLDGRVHEVRGHERTLGSGSFLAVHVRNDQPGPRFFQVDLIGLSLAGQAAVEHSVVQGFFAMEAIPEAISPRPSALNSESPSPEPRAPSPERKGWEASFGRGGFGNRENS